MEETKIKIGDRRDWRFTNGDWADGESGELFVVPEMVNREGDGMQAVHFAFHTSLCYGDCTLQFQFNLSGHSDVGVIFRACDETNFHVLHFPNCAQASRAQHFWAALSRMDESGYLRRVGIQLVNRVPSTNGVWLDATVTVVKHRIHVRVGDYGNAEFKDNVLPGPGHMGLFVFSIPRRSARIRDVRVTGRQETGRWKGGNTQPVNWFHPKPDDEGVWQQPLDIERYEDGELLMLCNVQHNKKDGDDAQAKPFLLTSKNNGRIWTDPVPLSVADSGYSWSPARIHLTPKERLLAFTPGKDHKLLYLSKDRGCTWESLGKTDLHVGPPTEKPVQQFSPQGFLNLSDGGILALMLSGHEMNKTYDFNILTWGSWHYQAFVSRSDDDGLTWTPPANIDVPGRDDAGKALAGNLDLTEPSAVQLSDGRVMVFIRPIYSPWMWETWSDDGGKSWSPCVRGPFAGYAAPNMVRTSSGALIIAHRMPMLTLHCSLDEGRNWDQGTTIDSGLWAMGALVEVEPDVVLYAYWDTPCTLMRAQYFRIGPSGLEPFRSNG